MITVLHGDPAAEGGVVDDDVGITAHGDLTLLGIESDDFGRCGGKQIDKAFPGDPPGFDAVRPQHGQAILDAGAAIGDPGEVADALFLVVLKPADIGSVVRAHGFEPALLHRRPQGIQMLRFAQGGRADILGAFKIRFGQIGFIQRQIMGAGLTVDGQTALVRPADGFHGFFGGNMDHKQG